MKIFICVVLVLAAVAAEPPFYRSAKFKPEKESESVPAARRNDEAPYPASGFRPPTEFVLPARQEVVPPATSYGVPADSYAAPFLTYVVPRSSDTQYGPPVEKSEGGEENKEGKEESGDAKPEEKEGGEETGEAEELSEGEHKEEGEKPENKGGEGGEEKKGGEGEEKNKRPEVITTGAYYILLPDSQLQRVQFRTEDDLYNMAYTARLQYSNEGRAPLYVYSPVPVPQYGLPASSAYVQWY